MDALGTKQDAIKGTPFIPNTKGIGIKGAPFILNNRGPLVVHHFLRTHSSLLLFAFSVVRCEDTTTATLLSPI